MNLAPKSRENERVQNYGRARALLEAEPAGWMETLGARIAEAEPGRVVVELIAGAPAPARRRRGLGRSGAPDRRCRVGVVAGDLPGGRDVGNYALVVVQL